MGRKALIILAALVVAGCAPVEQPPHVVSTITPFHQLSASPVSGKKMAILAHPADRQTSLEFATYRDKMKAKFSERGINVIENPLEADWLAFLSYGIDNGTQQYEVISVPVFGQTGGGATYHSGTVSGSGGGFGSYSGTSYTMPTFGVTSYTAQTVTSTTFQRNLALDIVDRASLDKGAPVKLYEGRLVSRGSCGSLAGVFDALIDALFQYWPGVSGKPQTIDARWHGQC